MPDPAPGTVFDTPGSGIITTTYTVRPGDTLSGIAAVVGASVTELQHVNQLPNMNAITAGQTLLVLRRVTGYGPSIKLVPDSEIVNGPSAADFDLDSFLAGQHGFLSHYTQAVSGQILTGAQIVARVADQFSVHPRILLAALDFVGGWVTQDSPSSDQLSYPLGFKRTNVEGLYIQLSWAALRLNEGYYGWRLGTRRYVRFDDGQYAFVGRQMNAGTAAVQNFLAAVGTRSTWDAAAGDDDQNSFIQTYRRLFGDPWQNDSGLPVPENLRQPPLTLPWGKGEMWVFTGGPHADYGEGTPWGALDFTTFSALACTDIPEWARAMASGTIARSDYGEVALSLDPSGDERIGWSVLYLHIGSDGRVPPKSAVKASDRIGHPSCEGGLAEGAHVHLARKFNGEWMGIDGTGAIPFVIGGWTASESGGEYDGTLTRGGDLREACECKLPLKNGIAW